MNQKGLKLFNLPNLITSFNFLCGVLAIILAFFGRIEVSALFLIAAMIFDFFDGFAARKLGIGSPIGKDLDSLADLVSFGLAPGILMFVTIELRIHGNLGASFLKFHDFLFNNYQDWLSLSALSIPFFSLFRLAKFNNDSRQSDRFIGVPTPTATIFFAFFPLYFWFELGNWSHQSKWVLQLFDCYTLSAITLLFSMLMVVELPLIALKFKTFAWKDNQYRFLLLLVSLISIPIFLVWAIPIIVILYLILSLIEHYQFKKHEIQS